VFPDAGEHVVNVETIGLMLLGLGILVLFAVGLSRPRRKSPLNLRETRPAPAPPPEDEEDLQKELDRIFDKPVPEPPKPKPRRKWVRALGVIARIALWRDSVGDLDVLSATKGYLRDSPGWAQTRRHRPHDFLCDDIPGAGQALPRLPDKDDDSAWDLWESLGVVATLLGAAGAAIFFRQQVGWWHGAIYGLRRARINRKK
jgi:hypothetical protein